MSKISPYLAACALTLSACATPHDTSLTDLRAAVGARVDGALPAQTSTADRAAAAEQTAVLLKSPLTFDGALRVALLNAPRLQRLSAEIALAAAERDGVSQPNNPILSGKILPSLESGTPATLEFGILANLIDMLTRPARTRVANGAYDVAKLTIAAQVVGTAQELKGAYIEAVAAQNALAVERQLDQAATASAELAARFHDAGNIPLVKLRLEQAARAEVADDLAERELAAQAARERLALLMGVDANDPWIVPAMLPPPSSAPDVAGAIDQRLDVQAARAASTAALATLKYHSDWRLWRDAGLGVTAQRDGNAPWAVGPQIEVALPIFNQGGPDVARAAASAIKADRARAEVEQQAASEIRMARATLQQAEKRLARYREEILPLRSEIVDLKMKEYDRMFIGAFEVLAARKDAATADLAYVKALRDDWLARTALDTALGGGTAATPVLSTGGTP